MKSTFKKKETKEKTTIILFFSFSKTN